LKLYRHEASRGLSATAELLVHFNHWVYILLAHVWRQSRSISFLRDLSHSQ